MAGKYEINMTEGSLTKSIVRFSLPLIFTNMLQLLYNAMDMIVVGRFVGTNDLAAVGATASLVHLFVNLFVGLSTGVTVLISKSYGAGDSDRLSRGVHTAFAISLILGIVGMINAEIFCRKILMLMNTPPEVLDKAVIYVTYYFMGMPGMLVYNFCAAILMAVGDTKRPLFILTFSGIVNVVLNLVFVLYAGMGVEGVAIATSVANYISAFLVCFFLRRAEGDYRLSLRKARIYKNELIGIFKVGLPAGIQSCIFSMSNVLIQSAINGFGATVVAGNTAASNLDGFVYTAMNSVQQGTITATSQNFGARNKVRVKRSFTVSCMVVTVVGVVMGGIVILARKQLLGFYTTDPEVIHWGEIRLIIICSLYFICGIMEVSVSYLRGVGYSLAPTIVSIFCVCGLRILWIYTIFKMIPTVICLYFAWPVTQAISLMVDIFIIKKFANKRINKYL